MKKNKSLFSLFRLYLSYHLNRLLFLIFIFILVLWCIVLILNSGYPLEEDIYCIQYEVYHFNYLEQSIFFLQMIDGVIISLLVGSESSSLSLFDPMFVPNTSRVKLILAKILANLFILIIILFFQILCLDFIGLLIFPKFFISILSLFQLTSYLFLSMFELLLLGEFFSLLFNSYFIGILVFIIAIVSNILLKIEKISDNLCYFVPTIVVRLKKIEYLGNLTIYLGICILLILASILVFQKKDISN